LHPETPLEGRTLEDLFAGRGLDIPQVLARLKRTADDLGLPFTTRSMTYNSRRAQELGKWAETMGQGEAFHHEAFKAYFADGRNIADRTVLEDIARSIGLDGSQVAGVLDQAQYKSAVDQDWQRCYDVGITAVPTFQMAGRYLVGAQPYDALRRLVSDSGIAG
jgi:predicted DsbA family dithiol-disulfide isomerase